jgi:hypothetical protein
VNSCLTVTRYESKCEFFYCTVSPAIFSLSGLRAVEFKGQLLHFLCVYEGIIEEIKIVGNLLSLPSLQKTMPVMMTWHHMNSGQLCWLEFSCYSLLISLFFLEDLYFAFR